MSSSVCNDVAPGSGSLFDIINNFACDLTSFVYSTLGITSNINHSNIDEDTSSNQNNNNHHHHHHHQTIIEFYEEFSAWLAFDEFQLQLFKVFAFLLVSNVALIYVAWHVYGARISDRFMKPATSAAVEELKKSVSRLKLPKEHSPRV